MSDEEKKAIEGLFHLAHINTYLDLEKEDVVEISRVIIKQWKDETKIVLNLIEKQSKEIEEYKKQLDLDNECEIALNSKVMDLEKEIEELKRKEQLNKTINGFKNFWEGITNSKLD